MAMVVATEVCSMDRQAILGDYETFLSTILQQVADAGFDLADFSQIDHMCYRTTSLENYEAKKQELAGVSKLLAETMINERPICTFRLHDPVLHDKWRVDAIELPAPKEGATYPEGLEHIEFVLYDDIPTFLEKYKDKNFELRAADRGINPEIGYKLGDYTVKFHLLSLTTVVYLEHKLGITSVKDGE